MKQNERLLVYAVTSFLALILVIAVLFGNDPNVAAKAQENTSNGLSDILQASKSDAELAKADAESKAKAKAAELSASASAEQPLNAKPYNASDVVARVLGKSRRERIARWVTVKSNDSFPKLVKRWCPVVTGGDQEARDFHEEALQLNEDTVTLIAGRQVMVPWVDDEVLAEIIEAQAAPSRSLASSTGRTLMDSAVGTSSQPVIADGWPRPSVTLSGSAVSAAGPKPSDFSSGAAGAVEADAGVVTYKVKDGDSIWRIATKRYGKANAPKMVQAIESLNPDVPDLGDLRIGQKVKIPAKAE